MTIQGLSIVVCTFNRSAILETCLDSLIKQLNHPDLKEIIVVDNGSTDQTRELVKGYHLKYPKIKYLFEKNIGLSQARNKGYQQSKGEWICYLDDDAEVEGNYVKQALWGIRHYKFDCFGGVYISSFKYGQPRWLDDNFGATNFTQIKAGLLVNDNLWGGNFLIKRILLEEIGGFQIDFGMAKNEIAYGEEDFLQIKLRQKGYLIGFDPDLIIYHTILPHKLRLSWHLQSFFASSKYQQRVKQDSIMKILLLLFRSLLGGILHKLPISMYKLLFTKEHYWENLILDIGMPIAYRLGQLSGYFKWSFK